MNEQICFFPGPDNPEQKLFERIGEFREYFNALMPILQEFLLNDLRTKRPPDDELEKWEKIAENLYNEYEDTYEKALFILEDIEKLSYKVKYEFRKKDQF